MRAWQGRAPLVVATALSTALLLGGCAFEFWVTVEEPEPEVPTVEETEPAADGSEAEAEGAPGVGTQTQRFEAPDAGFSVELPADWAVFEDRDDMRVVAYGPVAPRAVQPFFAVYYDRPPPAHRYSAGDWLRDAPKAVDRISPGAEVISSYRTHVHGYSAARVLFEFSSGGRAVHGTSTLVIVGKRHYELVFLVDGEQIRDHRLLGEHLVSSFDPMTDVEMMRQGYDP